MMNVSNHIHPIIFILQKEVLITYILNWSVTCLVVKLLVTNDDVYIKDNFRFF